MGNSWWDPRGWFSRPQTFASPENTRFYSMQMALDSGLLTEGASTREAALSVPAVLRGRNMICNIATLPLNLLDPDRRVVRDPLFEQLDPAVPNVVTLAMTVEDMLCDGIGWWEVTARGSLGYPTSVQHVDSRRVTINPPTGYQNPLPSGFDPASTIYVDGRPRSAYSFIRFDSPNPPLLVAARRAISRAVLLEDAAAMYAEDPRPFDYFTPAEGAGSMTREKITEAIRSWIASRRKRATAFVPETLQYNTVQAPNPADLQLVQLQQRAALDIANAIGIDPEDLGISTTSRTYQNATDRRQDRVNDVLSAFMRAITDRLSMADVTREGFRAVFDLDDYMRADPTTRWGTYQTAIGLGVMGAQEVREREDLPGRIPEPAAVVPDVIPVTNAREGSMRSTFDAAPRSVNLRLDDDGSTFSVDREHRVITGRAVLWDVPAQNGEGTFTFRRGSVEWKRSAVNRVKLLRDHDWGALLGAATAIKETPEGLDVKFKVARGPAGDQALAEAEDGALDGLSIGVDITQWEETGPREYDVTASFLNETSLTPRPAFDDARLTSVAASHTKGTTMPDKTPDETPALTIDYDALAGALAKALKPEPAKDEKDDDAEDKATEAEAGELAGASLSATAQPAQPVNSAAREMPGQRFARVQAVKEASPYTFDRAGRFARGEHDFASDLIEIQRSGDVLGDRTAAGKRVMEHIQAAFDVDRADVTSLNPAVNRPDMYYEAPANRTPLWSMVNKGGLPNGLSPFVVPKFNSASGLVGDHTEGTEPGSGTFTTTSQTITPTPVSGKASITREVWELGGNPATSNLIWNRMVRDYDQSLETATATFLATLTAATDVVLTTAAVDAALAAEVKAALIALNFAPAYDFSAFALEQILYTALAEATDANDRPLFPAVGPSNADGTAGNLFQTLNINGLRGVPAGALASTAGAANSSWLFDPSVVAGWSSAPQRLEFAGTDAAGDYAPVAMIDIAIWGYKAFANYDIAGVRQVTYDDAA